jgi:hypothetical protein
LIVFSASAGRFIVKTQLENMELFSIPALASTFVDYVSFLWNPISDLKGRFCDSCVLYLDRLMRDNDT